MVKCLTVLSVYRYCQQKEDQTCGCTQTKRYYSSKDLTSWLLHKLRIKISVSASKSSRGDIDSSNDSRSHSSYKSLHHKQKQNSVGPQRLHPHFDLNLHKKVLHNGCQWSQEQRLKRTIAISTATTDDNSTSNNRRNKTSHLYSLVNHQAYPHHGYHWSRYWNKSRNTCVWVDEQLRRLIHVEDRKENPAKCHPHQGQGSTQLITCVLFMSIELILVLSTQKQGVYHSSSSPEKKNFNSTSYVNSISLTKFGINQLEQSPNETDNKGFKISDSASNGCKSDTER